MRFQIVDTFTDSRFAGNPAAVVVAPEFPPVQRMRQAAHQIGLPTTAFVVPNGPATYRVRWFTPYAEINLCGHATIASARHLFARRENAHRSALRFESDNGVLFTELKGDLVAIDLPAAILTACDTPPGLLEALDLSAARSCVGSSDDILIEVESPDVVSAIRPDFPALAKQPFRGHIVTARGFAGVDFVSRTFFPSLGVDEDQVCVTAHCKLAPFWAGRLGQDRLRAVQLSNRGGRLDVAYAGDRVQVLGTAVVRGGIRELALEP